MGPIVRVLVVLLCGLTATAALASTCHEVDVTCPIDGQVVKTREAKSGTKLGNYLDMKPYGPMPAPWPIARCPGNGFVIYKPVFSSEELQRFRAYVATDEYRALLRPHSNYYLAARLQIHNGEPPRQVAYTLLKASWEAEGTELYPRYAREALEMFGKALAGPFDNEQGAVTAELLAGELERRLGMFDAARARFERLRREPRFQDGFNRDYVALQLELIAARDRGVHRAPEQ